MFQSVTDFSVAPTRVSGTMVQMLVITARFIGMRAHARMSGMPTTPPPIPRRPLRKPIVKPMPPPRAVVSSWACSSACSWPPARSMNSRTEIAARKTANMTRNPLASTCVLTATPSSTKIRAAGRMRRAYVHSIFPARL